jgi:hypothetical protein
MITLELLLSRNRSGQEEALVELSTTFLALLVFGANRGRIATHRKTLANKGKKKFSEMLPFFSFLWYFGYIKPNGLGRKGKNEMRNEKEKVGAKVALVGEIKKIVAKEQHTAEYIAGILKGLVDAGHSHRSIKAEWEKQSGRKIAIATISHHVAIAESKSGANAQALLKELQGNKITVEQVRTLTPAKAKELDLMSAPVRKVRTPKPKAKATTSATPADQIQAINKAIQTGKTLSAQDRANAIKATQALLEMLIATS